MRTVLAAAILCSQSAVARQHFSDFTTPLPLPDNAVLVIGFLGGLEHWNDPRRGVRKTTLRLRDMPGVFAEPVENHRSSLARELIFRALDKNRDGRLDESEKAQARIILYGQSLGGWALVRLARELNAAGIPVLLTVQVDSIGFDDTLIPPNVKVAANLYQRDFLPLRGAPEIQAADSSATTILGNFRYHYEPGITKSPDEDIFRTVVFGAHKKMELDSDVWNRVECLIREAMGR